MITFVGVSSIAPGTGAQEMEPRTYSASPIGTNFLLTGYKYTTGNISTNPALPVTDVQASLHTGTLAYVRTFALAGHSASVAASLPYVLGDLSGQVGDQSRQISRSGLGDLGLRFAANLFGGPALTPGEFVQHEPTTTLGASLTIIAPTGQYDPARLINISSNRWAFKSEIGLSHPMGNWFMDAAAGVWVYTANTDYLRDNVRSQDPLWALELHAGYNFRPGLWLAADATYYTGGETSLNGAGQRDLQANSRYGLTLSVPLAQAFSVKLAWSTGLFIRTGGNFDTVGLTLQYRWFDP